MSLGRTVITSNAASVLDATSVIVAIGRHSCCDWGNVDAEDKASNDLALIDGGRLLSSYLDASGTKFWIITEADRSSTTVLLPEDY